MKAIVGDMLKIYKPLSGMDWMNYRIVRKSDMTAHHIIKKEHGGRLEVPNVALLMPTAHQYLHIIEFKDLETYVAINKLFKLINDQGHEPTPEQREIMEYFLRTFETEHKWDKGSKGKCLVKHKYLERGL